MEPGRKHTVSTAEVGQPQRYAGNVTTARCYSTSGKTTTTTTTEHLKEVEAGILLDLQTHKRQNS